MSELVMRGERVLIDGALRPATIQIRDGRIASVGKPDDVGSGVPVHDAGSSVLMAGLVDTHVHVNEPGRAEWEGFETATRAAAAGGVTTLLDMPLNSIRRRHRGCAGAQQRCAGGVTSTWVHRRCRSGKYRRPRAFGGGGRARFQMLPH